MIDKGIVLLSIYDAESYALRVLSAVLKREGYHASQIYFKKLYTSVFPYTEKEVSVLIDLLVKLKVKLLCVSLRSSSLKSFSSLLNLIKQKLPKLDLLMGGTHSTLDPYDALKYADAVCVGDGEETIVRIAEKYNGKIESLSGVKGILIKSKQGEVEEAGVRGVFSDLSSLPIELYEDEDKYFIENDIIFFGEPLVKNSSVEVFASRGCPRQCTFCSNSILKKIIASDQKYVRTRGVRSTIDELLYLKKKIKNLKRVVFADEVFGLNKQWVEEFCDLYSKEINLPFSALFYVSLVEESKIALLKKAGLTHARVGVQSGSERIRKDLYKRIESDDQIIATGKLFNRLKVRFTYDLIVNNPYEEEVDKFNTLRLLTQMPKPFELNLHSLVYFPKTELTQKALLDGIIKLEDVEGKDSCKGLFLTNVLSEWPGNDIFWNSLFSLSSKSFVSKRIILWMAGNSFLKKKKRLMLYMAKAATVIKILQIGACLVAKREITFIDALRTLGSMIGRPLTNK